jgi:hypothetical protein
VDAGNVDDFEAVDLVVERIRKGSDERSMMFAAYARIGLGKFLNTGEGSREWRR